MRHSPKIPDARQYQSLKNASGTLGECLPDVLRQQQSQKQLQFFFFFTAFPKLSDSGISHGGDEGGEEGVEHHIRTCGVL